MQYISGLQATFTHIIVPAEYRHSLPSNPLPKIPSQTKIWFQRCVAFSSPKIRNFLVPTLSHTLPPDPNPNHHNLISLPLIHLPCPTFALTLGHPFLHRIISQNWSHTIIVPSHLAHQTTLRKLCLHALRRGRRVSVWRSMSLLRRGVAFEFQVVCG